MISNRAVVDTRSTGLGPNGRYVEQMVHARASAAISSTVAPSGDDATMTQLIDHLGGEVLGRRFEGAQPDFRVQRVLIGRIDAGKIADLTGVGFLVKALRISAGTLLDRSVHEDLKELIRLDAFACQHAFVSVWRNK